MARIINTACLIPVIARLVHSACCELDSSYIEALKDALKKEESPYGREALEIIIKNADIAKELDIPCCQDTGTCVVFFEIGQEVSWEGAPLFEAVNEGVRKAYTEGFLRKSIVDCPLTRINTGDNTPAVLHIEIVSGSKVKITVMPKGGGSENQGVFASLLPEAGEEGIIDFVLAAVEKAGGKACPPVIAGVGIGGTMEYCALLAKKAVLRGVGRHNKNPRYALLEKKLLEKINDLGIGPLGTGGRISALAVNIEYYPCHITSLPAALNIQCHALRSRSEII